MQVAAIFAFILGLIATGLVMGSHFSKAGSYDMDCSDWEYLERNYQGDSEKCYDDYTERMEFASFIDGIGGALLWFSLILAISSNRLE